jgi:hypothetical protein
MRAVRAIRITRSTIVVITRGRPGPGPRLYVQLRAISCRYQRNRVSGVTRVSSSLNSLRPSVCAFRASRQRSASVKRRCFPPGRALSTRFSSCRSGHYGRPQRDPPFKALTPAQHVGLLAKKIDMFRATIFQLRWMINKTNKCIYSACSSLDCVPTPEQIPELLR